MICGMTIYQILWYYMIYSLLGWMIEVIYHAITLGKVVNRGFLNGPICPVYGSGVIMVLCMLYLTGKITGLNTNVDEVHPLILFVIGIIFATLIEFIAGFLLDKLFHARWWDYSDRKFNVNGYICLEFSIIWGLAIAFVLRVVQPTFERSVDLIPHILGIIILIIIYLTFVADIIITVLTVLKLNKELEKMEEVQQSILRLSDGMSEVIGIGTIKAKDKLEKNYDELTEKKQEFQNELDEHKEEFQNILDEHKEEFQNKLDEQREEYMFRKAELEGKYEHMRKAIMYQRLFGTRRLLVAFPSMKHSKYQDIIERIRK